MSDHIVQLAPEVLEQILRPRWVWDPPPPWLKLDEEMLHRFAQVELEFKQKELEIQMEKIQAIREVMG